MGKTNTPRHIANLLKPVTQSATDRRVWSIPLQGTWIPFFTATNVSGETAIPSEALGAPLRLQRNLDGTPKFSQTGRPVIRVVKELSDQIKIVRENFTAGLIAYAMSVHKAMPDEFKAQDEAAQKVGKAIALKDLVDIEEYLEMVKAETTEPETTEPETTEIEKEAEPIVA